MSSSANLFARRRRRLGTAGMGALLLIMSVIAIAQAVPSAFLELDGDHLNGSASGVDWANGGTLTDTGNGGSLLDAGSVWSRSGTTGLFNGGTYNGTTVPPAPPAYVGTDARITAQAFFVDALSVDVFDADGAGTTCSVAAGDPTSFSGQGGETNNEDLNTFTYNTGSSPNKNDLSNVAAIHVEDGADREVFFMAERVERDGDSHIDFEFLQAAATLPKACGDGTTKLSGHRTQGDLLLAIDFTNGGDFGGQDIRRWQCDKIFNPANNGVVCDPVKSGPNANDAHYEPITDSTLLTAVVLSLNTCQGQGCTNVKDAGGWPARNPNGTARATLDTNTILEGAIDLDQLGFTGCISTFLPHTRTSQSFTAQLKDFAGPIAFDTCNPAMTITKTPSVTNICNGTSTAVTYTYVVTNTGNIDLTNVDISDNTISGAQTAFELANGGAGNDDIPEGGSVTFTLTQSISSTTTNTVTVDADSAAGPNSASASASATVTARTCSISLTKTPSVDDICNGTSTSVTYTYVVTNTGNFFNASGTLSDDNGTAADLTDDIAVGSWGPLAPGGTATLTSTRSISATTTNVAVASGTSGTASVSATDDATVTARTCSISLTKTPSVNEVCIGQNEQVTYTYVVTNTGNFFSVSGTVTDNVLGSVGSFGPLAPGASATLTKVGTINATTTNIGTANGTFADPGSTSASATATATVTGRDCGGNIFHTGTTCEQFHLGAPSSGLAGTELQQVNYSVRANKITSAVNPGVFFYYTEFVAPSNAFTVDIVQSIATGEGFSTFFAIHQDGTEIRIFNDDCSTYTGGATVTNGGGQARVAFNQAGVAGQTFVISVKYDKSAHVGVTQPPNQLANGRDVLYNWETRVDGTTVDSDPNGLLFHKS